MTTASRNAEQRQTTRRRRGSRSGPGRAGLVQAGGRQTQRDVRDLKTKYVQQASWRHRQHATTTVY